MTARANVYHADMTLLSRYGSLGQPGPEYLNSFLDLEGLSQVQYALLMMRGACIAVFRTTSGRYGLFDPHSRGVSGLPDLFGRAIMLIFPYLSDVINRKLCREEAVPSCNYELKPVQFFRMNDHNRVSPDAPITVNTDAVPTEPCPVTEVCDDIVFDEQSTDIEIQLQSPIQSNVAFLTAHDESHQESTSAASRGNDADLSETIVHQGLSTDITSTVIQQDRIRLPDTHNEAPLSVSSENKMSKNDRTKLMQRQRLSKTQTQKDTNKREREMYALDDTFREKKLYDKSRLSDELHRKEKQEYDAKRYQGKIAELNKNTETV